MKKAVYIYLIVLAIILLSLFFIFDNNKMDLKSTAFENNGQIPAKYTCDGEDVNPSLEISNIPVGIKSLVLIMDDLDALKPSF